MAIFSFFKKPPHQRFEYKPRYYDAAKEEREALLSRYKDADPGDSEAIKTRISTGLRRKTRGASSGHPSKRSNLRLLAILVVLLWITYYFLQKYLPAIIDVIE